MYTHSCSYNSCMCVYIYIYIYIYRERERESYVWVCTLISYYSSITAIYSYNYLAIYSYVCKTVRIIFDGPAGLNGWHTRQLWCRDGPAALFSLPYFASRFHGSLHRW